MKKIRRQNPGKNNRYNSKRYTHLEVGICTVDIEYKMKCGKKASMRILFHTNGQFIRSTRVSGIKKYPPKYSPLYGKKAIHYVLQLFN